MASNILSLDVGERRVGVAIANSIARLPRPLVTLDAAADVHQAIAALLKEHDCDTLVVGLPRNLAGEDTQQTQYVRNFVRELVGVTVMFQDEALTSRKAEAELSARGKKYTKGEVDALAATYILEDYLAAQGVNHG